ncbi:ATP-binding cassette domain-containing protein [Streptomyces sp. AgN23]|uniref:ABC transporter ATP-binding protein n=1 Tax=Streptomyces sp. AgN23 TaxID=1188315 RepID=UPI001B33F184|nr:ATP-binding cassette domain-containing protein [Streptomyces sp. AgN23]QTI87275.1 ABC transporter ATP-binding protein [Streptomyces sp. AgN23]
MARHTAPPNGDLTARGVGVRFEGVAALTDVDLDLRAGEILGLIGPNGAGKTTLVNVLSGYQRPTGGRVRIGGTDVTGWPPHRRARAGLVRTFQSGCPFTTLTVAENVEAAALAAHPRAREAHRTVHSLLDRFGLGPLAGRPAGTLSYGMLRRLALARALAPRPRLLLLDEPAAGLDDNETRDLGDLLLSVRDDFACGLLLIEHDVPLVLRICDRVHVLVTGRTLRTGTPADIAADAAVRDAYLGTAGPDRDGARA